MIHRHLSLGFCRRYLFQFSGSKTGRISIRYAHSDKSTTSNYQIPVIGGLIVAGAGAYWYTQTPSKAPGEGTKHKDLVKRIQQVKDLPAHVPYLLIGAGSASFAAVRAIRASDATSRVLMIGEEDYNPYMRPPLSKELWFSDDDEAVAKLKFKQWNKKERSVFYQTDEFYVGLKDLLTKDGGGVSLVKGHTVVKIDAVAKLAVLDSGQEITYDKALIATGGVPKNLPIFESNDLKDRITLFRNIDDLRRLYSTVKKVKSVTIVGGGFLGSELACALGKRSQSTGLDVVQIFPEKGNMGKVLPEYLSSWTTQKVTGEGVKVIPNSIIKSARLEGGKVSLTLESGESIKTDHIIVAVGLEPRTDLAALSGLEIDDQYGGFRVNAELEARSNLWIAGDAASFYDIRLGRRRVEHHDHAVVSGRLAGENMTGAGKPYTHQSMFWSDLGPQVGYEAIGIVDSQLPTVGVFAKATEKDTPRAVVEATGEGVRSETESVVSENVRESMMVKSGTSVSTEEGEEDKFGKGIIFYLRDKIIVGILMWNVFNRMSVARKILKESKPYNDLNEVAKLFDLYADEE